MYARDRREMARLGRDGGGAGSWAKSNLNNLPPQCCVVYRSCLRPPWRWHFQDSLRRRPLDPKIVQEVHGLPSRRHVILQIVSWAR